MKRPGVGIQNFAKFKEKNLIYVDKTEIISDLINSGDYYFLSRPRRFGKSLLVDTIKEILGGNKELFEECWIYDKWDWDDKYPVLKISFSEMSYKTQGLEKALEIYLDKLAEDSGIQYRREGYSGKFLELIKKLGKEKPVAVLIDEYDKPITDYLEKDSLDQARENRDVLNNFYQGIKDLGTYIRFLFITGVSNFSPVSSSNNNLNHLEDISTSKAFSNLLGYDEDEIKTYYDDYLKRLEDKLELSAEELMDKIRLRYNGYSWDGRDFIYNPFSIICCLKRTAIKNYWYETGSPTFLIKKIKEEQQDFSQINAGNMKISESAFNKYEIDSLNITAVMFQTGYLTIKEYDRKKNRYLLDFPNKEVKDSFLNFAISSYSHLYPPDARRITDSLIEALNSCQTDLLILELKSLFSSIPAKELERVRHYEGYYHSIIFIVMRIIGIEINCEVQTNHGITDAVIKTDDYIYVLEFKMGNAEEAIEQIKDKGYHQPYLSDKRKLFLLGIGFDREERNIGEFLIEEM